MLLPDMVREVQSLMDMMQRVVAISPDEKLLRSLKWFLEEAGIVVVLCDTLENFFFMTDRTSSCLTLVDTSALGKDHWKAEKILAWVRAQCPVVLLASNGFDYRKLQGSFDRILPVSVDRLQLLACLNELAADPSPERSE